MMGGGTAPRILNLAIMEVKWSPSRPGRLGPPPQKKDSDQYPIRVGWVGPRACLDVLEWGKNLSTPSGVDKWFLGCPLNHTYYAISAH
jgi:hypothetical protein